MNKAEKDDDVDDICIDNTTKTLNIIAKVDYY